MGMGMGIAATGLAWPREDVDNSGIASGGASSGGGVE